MIQAKKKNIISVYRISYLLHNNSFYKYFRYLQVIVVTISSRYIFSRRKCILICGYVFSWCFFARHLVFINCMTVGFASMIVCCLLIWQKRLLSWSVSYFSMFRKKIVLHKRLFTPSAAHPLLSFTKNTYNF